MSLDTIKQFHATAFVIPRHSDNALVEKLLAMAQEGGFHLEKASYHFTFAGGSVEFGGDQKDENLQKLLKSETVIMRRIDFELKGAMHVVIERGWDNSIKKMIGNQDTVTITPPEKCEVLTVTKLVMLARKHFDAVDTKPFLDFLDEGTKQLYQTREQDIQKLERMQENFFKSMTEFTLDEQKKQQAFQRQLETEYAARQTKLEAQHGERLNQLEAKEADLKKIRAEIDERENRQARRDIYKELKAKLKDRNQTFELTAGTKNRRRTVFVFAIALMGLLLWGFWYCFNKNVINDKLPINWVAIGSQIGFALSFIGVATFFIQWSHRWFQRHADEEFKLKRLDLDIDRAQWLVELSMEWQNITKSAIPGELIDKLSRNLFTADDAKDTDIHPAETLLSAIFGNAGSINVEAPGKFTMHRSNAADPRINPPRTD